jgi:hypothetical protein
MLSCKCSNADPRPGIGATTMTEATETHSTKSFEKLVPTALSPEPAWAKWGGFPFPGDETTFGNDLLAKCPAIATALQ